MCPPAGRGRDPSTLGLGVTSTLDYEDCGSGVHLGLAPGLGGLEEGHHASGLVPSEISPPHLTAPLEPGGGTRDPQIPNKGGGGHSAASVAALSGRQSQALGLHGVRPPNPRFSRTLL